MTGAWSAGRFCDLEAAQVGAMRALKTSTYFLPRFQFFLQPELSHAFYSQLQ